MADKNDNLAILSDSPLADPSRDRLGYAEFAQRLSQSIVRMTPEDGFVMGIYGKWGSGKTTVLNFVRHYLKAEPPENRPAIVTFNPWWFGDDEALIRNFFSQLEAGLAGGESRLDNVREKLGKLAQALSSMPDMPWLPSNSIARRLFALAAYLFLKKSEKVDVVRLKEQIAKELQALGQRIVVVVDDIDRLTADEIRQLFRIVKAIGNFPFVTYVLAFDKDVVVHALEGVQKGLSGEQYLEKIVQVPLPLPTPEAGSVDRQLFEKLDALIANTSEDYFESERWTQVYHDAIKHHMRTPRDVVRLVNMLQVTYPILEDNVNVVDFIGISFLAVFYPELYQLIRDNKDMFSGAADRMSEYGHREREQQKPFHDKWLEEIEEQHRGHIRDLMIHLFPKLDGIFGNTLHSDDDWEKQLRISSPRMFPLYFRLAIPSDSISNKEMRSIIALAQDAQAFADRLVELAAAHRSDKTTRLRAFLEQMESYTAEVVPNDNIPAIIQAFLLVGDQLSPEEDSKHGFFDFDNRLRIARILHQLLKRLEPEQRLEVMKQAIQGGKAISTIAYQVGLYDRSGKKKERDEERLFSDEQTGILRAEALKKIREAASKGTLDRSSELNNVLYRWKDWAESEEPRKWIESYIQKDEHLARLLEQFTSVRTTGDMRGIVSHQIMLDPQWLEPFLDPANIVDRVQKIADDSSYPEKQHKAAGRFLKEYEMRSRGLDPNNPLAEEEL